MLKRIKITVFNHGGKVELISKKPYRQSESDDIESIRFEDWPMDENIETKITEEAVEYERGTSTTNRET